MCIVRGREGERTIKAFMPRRGEDKSVKEIHGLWTVKMFIALAAGGLVRWVSRARAALLHSRAALLAVRCRPRESGAGIR